MRELSKLIQQCISRRKERTLVESLNLDSISLNSSGSLRRSTANIDISATAISHSPSTTLLSLDGRLAGSKTPTDTNSDLRRSVKDTDSRDKPHTPTVSHSPLLRRHSTLRVSITFLFPFNTIFNLGNDTCTGL